MKKQLKDMTLKELEDYKREMINQRNDPPIEKDKSLNEIFCRSMINIIERQIQIKAEENSKLFRSDF